MEQSIDIISLRHHKSLILKRVRHSVESLIEDYIDLEDSLNRKFIGSLSESAWVLLINVKSGDDQDLINSHIKYARETYDSYGLELDKIRSGGCQSIVQLTNLASKILVAISSEEYWNIVNTTVEDRSQVNSASLIFKVTIAVLFLAILFEYDESKNDQHDFDLLDEQKINFNNILLYLAFSVVLILILALVK